MTTFIKDKLRSTTAKTTRGYKEQNTINVKHQDRALLWEINKLSHKTLA